MQISAQRTTYANHQEDMEVLKFFGEHRGVFVEAGANHPVEGSQTFLLEHNGWHGVLIEPNPELAELCQKQRPKSQIFECALVEPEGPRHVRMHVPGKLSALASISADKASETTKDGDWFECPARTLDSVLEESGIERIDFFSIDLEGYEPKALEGFNWLRWRPQLVTIEDHCENLDTHRAVSAHGYKLVRRIGDNHWYVPKDNPYKLTLGERLRFIRKMYLSLPLRKLRRLSRALRGKQDA